MRFPEHVVNWIPMITEGIISCLDPSDPALRRSALTGATSALFQLVKIFPMVVFHQHTQRFAVGTHEGLIIIYDLRTATKWRILEGHKDALSALAFSEDGCQLGSYSIRDRTFRLWQCSSSGFFGGILGMSGKCQKLVNLPGDTSRRVVQSVAKQLSTVRIQFKSNTEWILRREDGRGYMVLV